MLVVAAVTVFPATALAVDPVLDFEGFAPGTVLSAEQIDLPGDAPGSERGIEWGLGPDVQPQFPLRPTVIVPTDVTPASGTRVLRPAFSPGCPPKLRAWESHSLCTSHLTGRFPLTKQQVSLRVGVPSGLPEAALTLRLLDVNGALLGSDTEIAQPGTMGTILSVALGGRTAAYMTVEGSVGSQGPFFYADDVSFDAPVDPPPADFGMKVGLFDVTQLDLIPGQQSTVPITLSRVNRSQGPITMTVGGLPTGVTATFAPPTLVGKTGISTTLTVSATAAAPDISLRNLTVFATPGDATAGTVTRTGFVRLSVETLKIYDAQITGMEITQGTQYAGIPQPDPFDPAVPVPYAGVQLVGGRRTIVRVFANNARALPLGGLGAEVILRGFDRNGKELPGSPLWAVAGPDGLLPSNGGLGVSDEIRRTNKAAYTFVLPDVAGGAARNGVWPVSAVRLRAEIIGPGDSPSFFRQTQRECPEPRCRANNAFTVTGISWAQMPILNIWPIQVTGPQQGPPPSPWEVFDQVQWVTPMSVQVPYSYKVTISDDGLDYGNRDDLQDEIESRIEDWADSFALDGYLPVATGRMTTGVKFGDDVFDPNGNEQPVVIVRGTLLRPLTSVAHEVGHALGRPHAGQNCDGTRPGEDQEGESWMPDDQGRIQGYGLNVYQVGFAPPPIFATDATTTWFDLMSYCAPNTPETGVWVAPRGWDAVVSRYRFGTFPLARSRPKATGQMLHVSAIVRPTSARIAVVRPGDARTFAAPASAFTARAFDAGGGLLAQTELFGGAGSEGGGRITLRGDLPLLAGIARIEIVGPGGVVRTTMTRTANAPTVQVTAPTAGVRVRAGRSLVVTWTSADADGDALRAAVDYSVDGGTTWRPLGVAPSTGSLTLGASLLQGSTKARVRVRVRDTLDEAAAISPVFRVDGSAPKARILDPLKGSSVPADAILVAHGDAYDDGGRSLTGQRLTWTANGRIVGRGASVSLRGLPPGRVTLSLRARDTRGRSGVTSIVVRVRAVRPVFSKFANPSTVRRSARSVQLRVATNVAAVLVVQGQRFKVGPTARRITVRIPAGGSVLNLKLVLRAGGRSSTATVQIPRN